jgi:peptide/nickel transport system permease protein
MTLVSVSMIIFVFTELVPGDAAEVILGQQATPESLENLRKKLGLDRPLVVRYVDWFLGWPEDEGSVYGTRDGGERWSNLLADTAEKISETYFLTPQQGWAVSSGRIYVTKDGGRRWNRQFRATESLSSIAFGDEEVGMAVAANGTIYRTTNGGVPGVDPESQGEREVFTWFEVDSGTSASLTDLYFPDSLRAWVTAEDGNVHWSEDGGVTWQESTMPEEVASLRAISFAPDAVSGVAVGESGTVVMSSDGGKTWRRVDVEADDVLSDVEFAGAATVWAVGESGVALQSRDGGATWANMDVGAPGGMDLLDVAFDGASGAITGADGFITTTGDGGVTWTLRQIMAKAEDGTDIASEEPFRNVTVRVTPEGDVSMWAVAIGKKWDWGLIGGNFSRSIRGDSVNTLIANALPASLLLAGIAFVVSVPTSLIAGVVVGLRPDTIMDRVLSQGSIFVISFPDFVTGILLMLILASWLDLLPASSLTLPGQSVWNRPDTLVLPTLTVTAALFAYVMRMARANVIEVMNSAFVRTAILKGIPMRRVVIRHVLPNALLPTITVIMNNASWMFGGLAIIETVFAYPGIGRLLLSAIGSRDVPLIQGTALIIACVTVFSNLFADLTYGVLDPRIRLA